ncbi:exodeoxyribonuclease VII small subunit [Candidatus Uhrbacteria bacterium]|nr:exodeoxyribonuclease VII small subunit [Candidatus Uhrbacteria bacterium]
MTSKKTVLNFSKAFEELEGITRWFDSQEQLDLDKGLKQFERGLELASELKKKLSEVENKVEEIKKKFADPL